MLGAQAIAHVREIDDSVRVIDIQGEVNAQAENILLEAFSRASRPPVKAVVLNFSGLGYMNSSGIGLIVTLLVRSQRQGTTLLAYGLNEHYQAIFELTRLNEAIQIFPDENQALAFAREAG